MTNCSLEKRLQTGCTALKLLGTAHRRAWQSRIQHIVHQQRSAFYELGCLGMQPKMRCKLLLKVNIGTRPMANKYHEGKMKNTLKRKLIVRETVEREAMHCWDSGSSVQLHALYGSEWIVCACLLIAELSHFPAVCVNSCWNWVISPARR